MHITQGISIKLTPCFLVCRFWRNLWKMSKKKYHFNLLSALLCKPLSKEEVCCTKLTPDLLQEVLFSVARAHFELSQFFFIELLSLHNIWTLSGPGLLVTNCNVFHSHFNSFFISQLNSNIAQNSYPYMYLSVNNKI